MAGRTINLQPQIDVPEELEARIIAIPDGSSPLVPKPDVKDDQKRWLVIGICLHSIISPALRQYVNPIITSLYNSMKQSYNIHTQTYPNELKLYPPTNRNLNYEAVNNNATIPLIRGRRDYSCYDYKINSAVDFSKLFLVTNMAHYSGFDDTCDSSALLGMIRNIDKFPGTVQSLVDGIRTAVRNPWAHCNFAEWDITKYLSSFQIMNQLIKHLNLTVSDETRILAELSKWEINGINFLQGTTIGLEILNEVKQHIDDLAQYALKVKSRTELHFDLIYKEIFSIQQTFMMVSQIEIAQQQQSTAIQNVGSELNTIKDTMEDNRSNHENIKEQIRDTDQKMDDIADNLEMLKEQNSTVSKTIQSIERKTNDDFKDVRNNVSQIQQRVQKIEKYMLHSKPMNKVYFYPPNRTESFIGRHHELSRLEKEFLSNKDAQHTQAICGLGGCGKTSISIEFSWMYQSFYPGGVFWMSAESNEALEDSIATLSIDVNVVGRNSTETLKKTLKWLAELKSMWLLVVDNVDGETISGNIEELLLGTWKRNSLGHILITSRREEIEIEESLRINSKHCMNVDSFQCTEGIEFMKKRTGLDSDDNREAITTLVEELGGLPLALEQAASHIKRTRCSFEDYIIRFKKKRLSLLTSAKNSFPIQKERLAVTTTWQLNIDYIAHQSKQDGMGTAAVIVMDMVSFLYAEDIPREIFNTGEPCIDDIDLQGALDDEMGSKQIIEILTRFSLFQRYGADTLSVHRLVQEVIRDLMNTERRKFILQCGIRMINKALHSTATPEKCFGSGTLGSMKRGSFITWNKIALCANVLKSHLLKFSNDKELCFSFETAKLLQTTAIYHSINQRQNEAMADQTQMLQIITTFDLTEEQFKEITSIKIPLLEVNRVMIQNSIAFVLEEIQDIDDSTIAVQRNPESLKLLGNNAFTERRYTDAIQYYTEGIRTCLDDQIYYRLLSNRSLSYLRINDFKNALIDASKCIEIAPMQWKGYCWKAYAIANMIKMGEIDREMEAVGLASVCVAANLHNRCLLKFRMKIYYPVVNYTIINSTTELGSAIMSLTDRPFTTLLLRNGRYIFNNLVITVKSLQVIGIEDGVKVDVGPGFLITRPPDSEDFTLESEINVHFENVFFVSKSEQIAVGAKATVTFFRCKFSNGRKGCDHFPRCKGESGCQYPVKCSRRYASMLMSNDWYELVGEIGTPALLVHGGGKVLVELCSFEQCGGCGIVCREKGSLLKITKSTVCNVRETGILCEGGIVTVTESTIIENRLNGIAVWARGTGIIQSNRIQRNGYEGILCGKNITKNDGQRLHTQMESKAIILDNIISQNGLCGICLSGGSCEVSGNEIFENWLWGLALKLRSSTFIVNNDIYRNKCGGIRIGVNYSASVIIDGNTIRDHSGPGIYSAYVFTVPSSDTNVGGNPVADEFFEYTRKPFVTNRNVLLKNDKGPQEVQGVVSPIKICCSCHKFSCSLKSCAKCKKATYCSKKCQSDHWKQHQHICALLSKSYTVKVHMKDIKSNNTFDITPDGTFMPVNIFHPSLSGILEGPPTDRKSTKLFIVKLQSGNEYQPYNTNTCINLYDRSVSLNVSFSNAKLYHLIHECGILSAVKISTKKIYCWASFKDNGETLCIHTDGLPPFQTW